MYVCVCVVWLHCFSGRFRISLSAHMSANNDSGRAYIVQRVEMKRESLRFASIKFAPKL